MSLDETDSRQARHRTLTITALANAVLWSLSITGLVFVMQRCSSANGLFVLLAGGLAVALGLIAIVRRSG